jgi:uncharacterized protein (TIGR04255 family)
MPDKPLPSFEHPPLVEVVLSVQFELLDKLNIPQLGLCWSEFKDKFPNVEQHPPLDRVIERIGVRVPRKLKPSFQFSSAPPIPRIWFIDPTGGELIQIQQDRFIRNWRKVTAPDTYPRYEKHIRPRFVKDLTKFRDFLTKENIGQIKPDQCEITYINHIQSCEVWNNHYDLNKVFTGWQPPPLEAEAILTEENTTFSSQYLLRDESNNFLGRLHIFVKPAFRSSDDKPIFMLAITARGQPLSDDDKGILEFFDMGRIAIVKSFKSITTPEMHKVWGEYAQ